MQKLDHQNIVKLITSFEGIIAYKLDKDWIFMILEYCNEGNLSKFQIQQKNHKFAYRDFVNIFLQILEAI